jgi:hypothetical protein
MSLARRLSRIEKQGAIQPEPADRPGDDWAARTLDRPADEARELARATAAEFGELVGQYKEFFKLSVQDAIARSESGSDTLLKRAMQAPPDEVSWHDLDIIARDDPAAAQRRWEEVKEAARGELRTGHRAAVGVNGECDSAWSRARFLAVRNELVDSLGPRNAVELLLIDQLAAYQVQIWDWQLTLTAYTSLATLGMRHERHQRIEREKLRLTDAEAMEQAAAMVERFQRMFCRALTAFQAQRRQTPVVFRRAAQVNLAQNQQINWVG